jgi:glycosyltransferase involved in cell wall biosynthesis
MVLGRSAGGIGAHVDLFTADLRAAGHEVVIATSADTAKRFGWSDAHHLWPAHPGWQAPRGLVDWHQLKNLAGTVDLVHAHGHQAAFVAAVAVARARPRPAFVVSLHNDLPATGPAANLFRRVLPWALRRAALVTGASPDLVDLAGDLGARRAELATVASPAVPGLLALPGQGDAAALRTARNSLGVDPGVPLVLTVARMAPQKDLPTLVAAASLVRLPATWVVVGGGDEQVPASGESEHSGIRPQFVGPQRDVVPWLRAADVFVLTSRWEARALVVQEAMAAGLAVVATRTGGLPDLVGDAALLVPVGDARAVAAAVDRLLGDPALRERLGRAARARATTWATSEEEARRWLSRYAEALRG